MRDNGCPNSTEMLVKTILAGAGLSLLAFLIYMIIANCLGWLPEPWSHILPKVVRQSHIN